MSFESPDEILIEELRKVSNIMESILDVAERIQQQLAAINNDFNLEADERIF